MATWSKEFWKLSLQTMWNGFLQNLLVVIITVGGSIFVYFISLLEAVQQYVRTIPTDYILVPFLILIIVCIALGSVYFKQKAKISDLLAEPVKAISREKMVTHYGVWWKISLDIDFIEDFPYCVCCEPHIKLVQIEWFEQEEYECPNTKTKYKLYDGVPRKREAALNALRRAYFNGMGDQLIHNLQREVSRLKELLPDLTYKELALKIFGISPLDRIPAKERDEILESHSEVMEAVYFVNRHFHKYKKYMRGEFVDSDTRYGENNNR